MIARKAKVPDCSGKSSLSPNLNPMQLSRLILTVIIQTEDLLLFLHKYNGYLSLGIKYLQMER